MEPLNGQNPGKISFFLTIAQICYHFTTIEFFHIPLFFPFPLFLFHFLELKILRKIVVTIDFTEFFSVPNSLAQIWPIPNRKNVSTKMTNTNTYKNVMFLNERKPIKTSNNKTNENKQAEYRNIMFMKPNEIKAHNRMAEDNNLELAPSENAVYYHINLVNIKDEVRSAGRKKNKVATFFKKIAGWLKRSHQINGYKSTSHKTHYRSSFS